MKKDKKFKAFVTRIESNERLFIECEARTKKEAIRDIRGNGYKCANHFVKEADVFDWVLNESGHYGNSADHYAIWQFTKIPQSEEEYKEKFKKYKMQYLRRKYGASAEFFYDLKI